MLIVCLIYKDGFCEKCYKWYRNIKRKLFCATVSGQLMGTRFFTLEEARDHVKDGGSIVFERRTYMGNGRTISSYSTPEMHKVN